MDTKHTPGPWLVNGRAIEQGKPKDALVVGYVEDEQNDDWPANAKLIAAAPTLAAVLEVFLSDVEAMADSALLDRTAYVRTAARAALRAAGRLP